MKLGCVAYYRLTHRADQARIVRQGIRYRELGIYTWGLTWQGMEIEAVLGFQVPMLPMT